MDRTELELGYRQMAADHQQEALALEWCEALISDLPLDDEDEPGVKVRDIIKRLEQEGWQLARTKGSHRQYHHPAKPGTVTVAGHPSADVPPGTLNNILKQAGLK